MTLDVNTSSPNHLNLGVSRGGAARPAAAARSKARAFGGFGNAEENYLFAARTARRARRTTVDAGRAHRKKDFSIKARVSIEHRSPKNLLVEVPAGGIDASLLSQCHGLAQFDYLYKHTRAECGIESIRILLANCEVFAKVSDHRLLLRMILPQATGGGNW